MLAALVTLAPALDAAAQGARGRSVARSSSGTTRTIVVIEDLDDARGYSTIVDRKRPALDRMDGTLRSHGSEARVAAFLENGGLQLIDERVQYGDDGGTARNRYYANDGKLVYFDSVRVRPRDVGKDKPPARDEVVTILAFASDGRLVGSEKTVNREKMPLPSTDETGIRSRFDSLAAAVAAGSAPAKAR